MSLKGPILEGSSAAVDGRVAIVEDRMREAAVAHVGRCPGCLKMGRLKNGACVECQKFGTKFGAMAERIRADPRYRLMCYGALKSDVAKRKFVEMFGETG